MAVIVPVPVPACVTVHHAASLSAIHEVFEVTSKLVLLVAANTFCTDGDTLRVGIPAAWVTVTLTVVKPVTLTVRVATRATKVGLAV